MVLIEAWNNLRESNDFKFYELRKIKICDTFTENSVQNIAISNNIIFISTQDILKVIVVPLVLEFEWSSKIQNQMLDSYNSVIIPISIHATYLSICGGKGGILVVAGPMKTNPNQSQIQLLDLSDLNAVNSDLRPFSTIDLPFNETIIGLEWHPEYNESLFVAVLANGVLFSVGCSLSTKTSQILGILPKENCLQSEQITCVSWSPKGKQFVVGTEKGQIIQIKHTNGTEFSVAKKIEPDPALKGYSINAIKWCFTPLFIASYGKLKNENEFDVRHITVYAPPTQKGKPAVQPVFSNHAQLCIEQYRAGLRYKTDFIHLGNVILCSTSYSSEIGVLVCDDVDGNVNNWVQLMLADENRIDLPMIRNNQTLSKGIAIYAGETKIFKIGDSQTIGGKNCPLLMIISSDGILNNYYVSYSKLKCPSQFETKALEFRSIPPIPSTQIPHQQTFNLQTAPVTPAQSSNQQTQQVNQQQQQNVSANIQTNTQTAFQSFQPQQQHSSNQLNEQQIQQQKASEQAQQEKLRALQIELQKAKEAELQKEKERKQLIEENHAYLVAIEEEVAQFSKIVLECKERYKKTNSRNLGNESEKRSLVDLTNGLESDLNEIKEKMKNIDIELLENFLLENLAMAEEARSRVERDNDSKLNILFKKKPLDPVTTRKIKEINNKTIYIETNLKEINYILDQQWQDYIVSEKGKKQTTVSPVNLVYQSRLILNSLESQLRALEPFLPWKDINYKVNYRKQKIKKSNTMGKLKISEESSLKLDENGLDEQEDDKIDIYRFTKNHRQNLLRILDSRPEIPIKRSSLPVDINSAIMISAVSKAKEKLKLTRKHTEKTQAEPVRQRVSSTSISQNEKIIEHQQQKSSVNKSKVQQQVKTTGTFVPPVFTQQPISFNLPQQSQQITPNKATTSSRVSNEKPVQKSAQPVSKAEPFKFSFNPTESNKPIQFGVIDQGKPQATQPQLAMPTKQTVKTTQPSFNLMTSVPTSSQQQTTTEYTFKPDQLNLTFDKSNLNLLSSTPIKNQQKVDAGIKSSPLIGQAVLLNQLANKQLGLTNSEDAIKQQITQKATSFATSETQSSSSKPADQQKSNLTASPKYEDISPANTPTVEKQQQNVQNSPQLISSQQQPQTDSVAFSFNALAALSKMPISTTFQTSSNSQFPPLNVLASGLQNLQNTSNFQTISTTTITESSTQSTIQSPPKTLFDQPIVSATSPTTTSTITISSPATSSISQPFGSPISAPLFGIPQPAAQTQGGLFGFGAPTATSTISQSNTTITTTSNSSITTTTASIFGMPAASTLTGNVMDLSKPKNASLTSQQSTTSPNANQSQQSILAPNQSSNIQSSTSVFGSLANQQQAQSPANATPSMQPFSLVTSPNNASPMQQQTQTGFGFSSMCNLGGKPNPENVNKNPFGGPISTNPPSATTKSLFGGQAQQQTPFGSNIGQPISTGTFSSPFSSNTNTGTSTFGSAPTFGTTSMSTPSVFGNTNTSSILNEPKFGFQSQQQSTVFGQAQPSTQFGAKPTFGAGPTFGAQSPFGSPQNTQSSQFGAKPTFGSAPVFGISPNSSFGSTQPPKTGFESFANANVPTFGSFSNAANSASSFEAIAHQPPQQPQSFGAFNSPQSNTGGFGSNTQFGGSQFSERRA